MAKKREICEYSIDPAAQEMLIRADEMGISTAFTRADDMAPAISAGRGCAASNAAWAPAA